MKSNLFEKNRTLPWSLIFEWYLAGFDGPMVGSNHIPAYE
jgi:hypothetical protein